MPNDQDVLKGIPRKHAVRRIVLFSLAGLAVLILKKIVIMPWLKAYFSVADRAEAFRRLTMVIGSVGLVMLGVSIWAALSAKDIFVSRQYPAPGSTVWRDTPIVRGRAARLRGWVLVFGAIVAFACTVLAAWLPFSLK